MAIEPEASNERNEPAYEVPARGESLSEQVYRQLCGAVLSGTYAPDERISIRRIAEELRVSATPARESVLRLISEGVLQATDRNAIIVPSRTVEEIEEIFVIRRGLEGTLAQTAASRLSAADLEFLSATQAAFLEAKRVQDFKRVLKYNSEFHFRIYRSAGLPVHLKIVEGLWLRIGPTLRYMYPILNGGGEDHGHHDDILDSARARDGEQLKAAIISDLSTSEIALHMYIRQTAAEARRRKARLAV
jgi:GntR family transcriptional regulator, colanic acid and biofilm gene transcriptional regulator